MAGAPQTLTALRDVSSLYSIHLVSPSPSCPSELSFIKTVYRDEAAAAGGSPWI